jgi:hypothetical protein
MMVDPARLVPSFAVPLDLLALDTRVLRGQPGRVALVQPDLPEVVLQAPRGPQEVLGLLEYPDPVLRALRGLQVPLAPRGRPSRDQPDPLAPLLQLQALLAI